MGEISRAFSCTLYVVLLFDSVYIEECFQGVGLSRNKGLSLLGVLVISIRRRFAIAMWVLEGFASLADFNDMVLVYVSCDLKEHGDDCSRGNLIV